jgi:hypothetical protein
VTSLLVKTPVAGPSVLGHHQGARAICHPHSTPASLR